MKGVDAKLRSHLSASGLGGTGALLNHPPFFTTEDGHACATSRNASETQQEQMKSFIWSIVPDVFPRDAVSRLVQRILSSMRGELDHVSGNTLVNYKCQTVAESKAEKLTKQSWSKDKKIADRKAKKDSRVKGYAPDVMREIQPTTFLQGLAPWHTSPPPKDAERALFAFSWLVQPMGDGRWFFSCVHFTEIFKWRDDILRIILRDPCDSEARITKTSFREMNPNMSQHQLDEFQQIMQFMQSHGPAFLQQSGHPGQLPPIMSLIFF